MLLQLSIASGIFALFVFLIAFAPGTQEFFLHQVVAWGVFDNIFILLFSSEGTYSFSFARLGFRHWAHLQTMRELQWDQKVGEWGFRVSFWVQFLWSLPLMILMTFKVAAKGSLIFTESALDLAQSGEGTFWEHLIFASLFAFMLKDCFLFYDTVDVMFTLHHFAVMLFMYCLYFINTINGVTALALCCIVAEIGTSSYCAYMIWNFKRTYMVVMTLSNLGFLFLISAVTYMQDSTKEGWLFLFSLYLMGVVLVLARQAVLFHEVYIKKYELNKNAVNKTK